MLADIAGDDAVSPARPGLVGRTSERQVLEGLLARAREGRSGVLVIRGEAGIGKTSLLEWCASAAPGYRRVSVAGVQSETEQAYAALQQVTAPMLDRLDALPAPQRSALRGAFGLEPGGPPDRFLVALAVLGLLAEASADRPVLCLVDDAHWLDAASLAVLGFVGRRLLAEPVVLLFAARPELGDELTGLPELVLAGLAPADAAALLGSSPAAVADVRVRERLIAETRGHPLALLELAKGRPSALELAGFGVGVDEELPERVRQRYLQQLSELEDETRRLLVVAAAEPTGDPVLLWRAARQLGVGIAAIPPEAHELVSVGARVAFAHPLVRSAVYLAAPTDLRRESHSALAAVTDGAANADLRAWHLAAATDGPDAGVASELERTAGRVHARGGFAAAAALLHRSVALTSDPEQRTARALAAARASLHAGAFDDARQALGAAAAGPLDALGTGRAERLRGQIAFAEGAAADASPQLLRAAVRLEPLDIALARETYLAACGAAMFGGPACAEDLLAVGQAVRALPAPRQPRALDGLLDGIAVLVTEGRAAAAPALLAACRSFARDEIPITEGLRWGWMATAAGNALWDDEGVHAVGHRYTTLARRTGALEQLPIYLIALGTTCARAGHLTSARGLIAEADAVAQLTRTRLAPFSAELLLAAVRGDAAGVVVLTRAATRDSGDGRTVSTVVADLAAALVANALGRWDEAFDAARRADAAPSDFFAAMWALPELIEAAVRRGSHGVALDAVERLAETTRPGATDYGLGMEARCRALVAGAGDAEGLHREAIERLGRTHMSSELARAHLLYGEWLRGAHRRRDAREQLRLAHDQFTEMGMAGYAERARTEAAAIGERLRGRTADARDSLTAQEANVAALAREGLTNTDIAARLFLSPRTVEWHLKNVFRKLGITSRRCLEDALRGPTPDGPRGAT